MNRFLRQIAVFAALQSGVGAALWVLAHRNQPDFLAATIEKHANLRMHDGPRILFVGGSNVAFGIDSRLVESELHYRPINMALQFGLGLEFMLNEISESLSPGNIVVLSPEYHAFGEGPQSEVQFLLLENNPSSVRYFGGTWTGALRLALDQWGLEYSGWIARRGVQQALALLTGRPMPPEGVYRRDAFNKYGDVVAHCGLGPQPGCRAPLFAAGYQNRRMRASVERLNQFAAMCRARNVEVYYAYPPLPRDQLEFCRPIIDQIDAELRRALDFPVLNSPEDVAYPYELFFDTPYHLNGRGRHERTCGLLAGLARQRVLEAKSRSEAPITRTR